MAALRPHTPRPVIQDGEEVCVFGDWQNTPVIVDLKTQVWIALRIESTPSRSSHNAPPTFSVLPCNEKEYPKDSHPFVFLGYLGTAAGDPVSFNDVVLPDMRLRGIDLAVYNMNYYLSRFPMPTMHQRTLCKVDSLNKKETDVSLDPGVHYLIAETMPSSNSRSSSWYD